eukprot:4887707-Pyramimonas_sp.AAC.3
MKVRPLASTEGQVTYRYPISRLRTARPRIYSDTSYIGKDSFTYMSHSHALYYTRNTTATTSHFQALSAHVYGVINDCGVVQGTR